MSCSCFTDPYWTQTGPPRPFRSKWRDSSLLRLNCSALLSLWTYESLRTASRAHVQSGPNINLIYAHLEMDALNYELVSRRRWCECHFEAVVVPAKWHCICTVRYFNGIRRNSMYKRDQRDTSQQMSACANHSGILGEPQQEWNFIEITVVWGNETWAQHTSGR